MENDLELFKFTKLYLGNNNWNYLKKTSKEEFELFKKYDIDLSKSYIVLGSSDLLNKFKAFYLTRCIKRRPLYDQFYMDVYASQISSTVKDDFGLNVDSDLIFLYKNNHSFTFGNSDAWLKETVLNKIANRNRDGLVTIILTEMSLPTLENSGELIPINLAGVIMNQNKTKSLSSISSYYKTDNNKYTVFD